MFRARHDNGLKWLVIGVTWSRGHGVDAGIVGGAERWLRTGAFGLEACGRWVVFWLCLSLFKNIFILWAPCGALHQKYTSSFTMCWDERSYVFMDSKIMWHWNTEKDIISMQRRLLCDLDISRGNVVQKHTMDLWTLKHEGSCRVCRDVRYVFFFVLYMF